MRTIIEISIVVRTKVREIIAISIVIVIVLPATTSGALPAKSPNHHGLECALPSNELPIDHGHHSPETSVVNEHISQASALVSGTRISNQDYFQSDSTDAQVPGPAG